MPAVSFANYLSPFPCVVGPINKARNSTFKGYLFWEGVILIKYPLMLQSTFFFFLCFSCLYIICSMASLRFKLLPRYAKYYASTWLMFPLLETLQPKQISRQGRRKASEVWRVFHLTLRSGNWGNGYACSGTQEISGSYWVRIWISHFSFRSGKVLCFLT